MSLLPTDIDTRPLTGNERGERNVGPITLQMVEVRTVLPATEMYPRSIYFRRISLHGGGGLYRGGHGGHGPSKILDWGFTMHLAPPIIGLYIR